MSESEKIQKELDDSLTSFINECKNDILNIFQLIISPRKFKTFQNLIDEEFEGTNSMQESVELVNDYLALYGLIETLNESNNYNEVRDQAKEYISNIDEDIVDEVIRLAMIYSNNNGIKLYKEVTKDKLTKEDLENIKKIERINNEDFQDIIKKDIRYN